MYIPSDNTTGEETMFLNNKSKDKIEKTKRTPDTADGPKNKEENVPKVINTEMKNTGPVKNKVENEAEKNRSCDPNPEKSTLILRNNEGKVLTLHYDETKDRLGVIKPALEDQPGALFIPDKLTAISTPDKPRAISTPDKPRAISTPDKPRSISTPDKPRAISTPNKPRANTTPIKHGAKSTPDKPRVKSTPDKPGANTTPDKPRAESASDKSKPDPSDEKTNLKGTESEIVYETSQEEPATSKEKTKGKRSLNLEIAMVPDTFNPVKRRRRYSIDQVNH